MRDSLGLGLDAGGCSHPMIVLLGLCLDALEIAAGDRRGIVGCEADSEVVEKGSEAFSVGDEDRSHCASDC